MELAKKHSEVQLKVRVLSLTNESIRVEHAPVFDTQKAASEKNKEIVNTEKDAPLPYGVLELRMAGIELPLSERALKQLKHPKLNLFGGSLFWNVYISNKLNTMSDTTVSVPVLFHRRKSDIQLLLLKEGFCTLTNQFRKVDFEDNPHEMSLTLSDRLVKLQ